MTGFENVGVFIREKIWHENSLSQQNEGDRVGADSYKYPDILNPSYSSYLPAYEDGTDRVLRNVGI